MESFGPSANCTMNTVVSKAYSNKTAAAGLVLVDFNIRMPQDLYSSTSISGCIFSNWQSV
ncbi:Hypothetical Protein CGB_G2600C [Cryptococcus gattii WM276]|uniref:Uncharacterized protein n=2 Tax=Cryptococcus gattii TaxID=37769 RepID=E6R9C4_CRYGW|nr:Hypothetical Protein CGB_G2600C [Cryptococcus gattii WM276]ADV23396.1 Hypothetical Protein CGB_G2600C [Cryptococcus gattii WM276]KIR77509.1 hypothetical protein I306_05243 [Cryptococcus gattii EJB2]KJE01488.1 hypothetical protein I311_04904 [Cryptococcus gattii NT-10]